MQTNLSPSKAWRQTIKSGTQSIANNNNSQRSKSDKRDILQMGKLTVVSLAPPGALYATVRQYSSSTFNSSKAILCEI